MNAIKNYIADFNSLSDRDKKRKIVDTLINNALYIIILLLVIGVCIYDSSFVSWKSIKNIMTLSSSRLVMALGIAGCVVLTGTDLSAGRMMGLTACISASLLQKSEAIPKMWPGLMQLNPIIPLLVVMAVGACIGAFSGFCVAKFKLHPFIVTLGTQLIVYGFSLIYVTLGENGGGPIANLRDDYRGLIQNTNFLVPNCVWIAIAAAIVMWFIWNKTVFGKNMFAVGCNEEAAKVSGVSVFRTVVLVFALAGLMYGFTGWMESARIGSNAANTGLNYELDAIAACVIGGVSFTGGVGKIRGVIVGVVLLQLIASALVFLDLPGAYTFIVKGSIIIIACAIDMRKYLVKK